MPSPPPPYVAAASPEAKAAHFAAKKSAVTFQARTVVGSFADADEETRNSTVADVLLTYETLDADTGNSINLGAFFDAQLGRASGSRRQRRSRQRRLLPDQAPDLPNMDVTKAIARPLEAAVRRVDADRYQITRDRTTRRLQDAEDQPDVDVSACVGGAPNIDELNWTFNGAAYFMLTVMTTIGYGTFSISTTLGQVTVVLAGLVTIVVFGQCTAPLQAYVDGVIERAATRLLLGIRIVSSCSCVSDRVLTSEPSATISSAEQLRAKVIVSLLICHSVIAFSALLAMYESVHVDHDWSYFDCYYFAFVTFSSIGFGDYALYPPTLVRLLLQALIIFMGMTVFNTSAGLCGDWASAQVDRLISRFKAPAIVRRLSTRMTSWWKACGAQALEPRAWRSRVGWVGSCTSEPAQASEVSGETRMTTFEATVAAAVGATALGASTVRESPCTAVTINQTGCTYLCARDLKSKGQGDPAGSPPHTQSMPVGTCNAAVFQSVSPDRGGSRACRERAILKKTSIRKFGRRRKRKASSRGLGMVARANASQMTMASSSQTRLRMLARLMAEAGGWLLVFYAIMLIGGQLFVNIEATAELDVALALRHEENQIRALAGMPLLGNTSIARRQLLAVSQASVLAELTAISTISDPEAQDAAVEVVVQSFAEVIDHEQGCDQLSDFSSRLLASCKSRPPKPISLDWTFTGAAFFMLTVMTTIGYGTFAPRTQLGKFVVIAYGTVAMTLFGICLGVICNCVDALVNTVAMKLLMAIELIEAKAHAFLGNTRFRSLLRTTNLADEKRRDARRLHCKMAVALGTLLGTLASSAALARGA